MSSLWNWLGNEIEAFNNEIRDLPVQEKVGPERVRDRLRSRFSFDKPIPVDEVSTDVSRMLRQWNVHVTHPRYFGLFNPSVHDAGIMADALAALYNPQLAVWSHAPAVNEIERHTLGAFSKALGFSEATFANFTTGGFEANFSAVLAALAHHFPESSTDGVAAIGKKPAVYVSEETHHSLVKITRMAGLGTNSLRQIPLNKALQLDPDALAQQIARDHENGWHPLLVVATAGTTGAGIVDPLPALADIAQQYGAWFHVDGAWGASASLSPRLRGTLAGIERADSLTWDAHKWLSVPMGAGMFFCRHTEAVQRAFAVNASYMPAKTRGDTFDSYAVTAQWSRRAIGLKVFMTLATLGLPGLGEIIEHQAEMGDVLRERLQDKGWLLTNGTRLPVICFTHPEIRAGHFETTDLLRLIYRRARVWISDTVLDGERSLRACITSFRTNEDDIDVLVGELETVRRELTP